MLVLENSVWNLESFLNLESGQYRVIRVFPNTEELIIFPLITSKQEVKPVCVSLKRFLNAIKEKVISKSTFELPSFIQKEDSEISQKARQKKEQNFALIKDLVMDDLFLYEYSNDKKSPRLEKHAKNLGTYRKKLARLVTLYWKYGQSSNALLPSYQNSGAPGKERVVVTTLGAPKQRRTIAIEPSKKYVLSSADKKNIKNFLAKFYLKVDGPPLKNAYEEYLKQYHRQELKSSALLNQAPCVPSYRQFSYWKRQLFTEDEVNRKRYSLHDNNLKNRAVIGSAKDDWKVPGSCFELDATVADVHIVSSFRHDAILGRPTIYSIVDRASGMIIGLNVSLFYASWKAARLALANAFLPKSEFCKRYDVDIVDSEWPCQHIPLRLMCDNGEMIGLKPQQTIVPFTELQFAPPYRGDFKSMVERRFGLLNSKVIHSLLGTTRGRQTESPLIY